MRLKRHRADLKFIARFTAHSQVDDKGCCTCQVVKRYRHLISWAEAVLTVGLEADYPAMERRERIVLKDGEGKR